MSLFSLVLYFKYYRAYRSWLDLFIDAMCNLSNMLKFILLFDDTITFYSHHDIHHKHHKH